MSAHASGVARALAVDRQNGSIVGHPPTWFGPFVFGGIALAQALAAARATVADELRARSLHAYFLNPAEAGAPIRYEVDAIRDGRSSCTRAVSARQGERATMAMMCSFAGDREGRRYELPWPDDVPPPEALATTPGLGPFEFAFLGPTPEREDGTRRSTHRAWIRLTEPLPDDGALHESALAFISDITWTAATPWQLGGSPDRRSMVSVDHALWLHRTARADEWLYFDVQSLVHTRGRGTIRGVLYGADRRLVCSMAQELQFR
jgi:acyl-CoA thioesterase-2